MSNFERKYGKYAIRNLSIVLVVCYVIGYVMEIVMPFEWLTLITLNPYKILHGQVWRLVTWILIPPDEGNILITVLMLYFYCSIGTTLERTWGTYRYNVYIFSGLLFTILGSFLFFGYIYLSTRVFGNSLTLSNIAFQNGAALSYTFPAVNAEAYELYFKYTSMAFSTYYINMSIFLAFAATYPDVTVLLMFIIPIKVKWLGIIDGVMIAISFFLRGLHFKFAILACLMNFIVFFLSSRRMFHLSPKQIHRRQEFRRDIRRAGSGITKHKCAICGRTEADSPDMQFRFCSKCDGNYEYCEEHLYTHTHVKGK